MTIVLNGNPFSRALGAALMLLAPALLGTPARADSIVLENNRAVDGLVCGENAYYVHINIRGTEVPIPRHRILEVTVNSDEENVRMLLAQTVDAVGRQQVGAARTLLEQARGLNPQEDSVRERIAALDRQVVELERAGGTPEQRRRRAQDLFEQAREAYNRVRIDQGNERLISALRTDPSFQPAHELIVARLTQSARPDLMLAAEYFGEAAWPDNITSNHPLIPFLPQIYAALAENFRLTIDSDRTGHYYRLLSLMAEAFTLNPDWMSHAVFDQRRMIEMPLEDLLCTLIAANLDSGQPALAAQKLNSWTQPGRSAQCDLLYARAAIGTGQTEQAVQILEAAHEANPSHASLPVQAKAANLLLQAEQAGAAGQMDQAQASLEQVFYGPDQVLPELSDTVGRRLSEIKLARLSAGQGSPWLLAEVQALNMRFQADAEQRTLAAERLRQALTFTPWSLEPTWSINGRPLAVPAEVNDSLRTAISTPLGIQFDENSPFRVRMQIDLAMSEEHRQLLTQAIETGNTAMLPEAVLVTGVQLSLDAQYPGLPTLLTDSWSARDLLPADQFAQGVQLRLSTAAELTRLVSESMPGFIPTTLRPLSQKLRLVVT